MSRWDKPAAGGGGAADAAAAAAAAAAKIAAQFRGPPGSSSVAGPSSSSSSSGNAAGGAAAAAPEFLEKIEINDQRNRYMLTKGATQQQVLRETGASVTTKGTWYPDKTLATEADPPLYLEVIGTSKETLERGVAMLQDLMKQDVPQLIEDRGAKRLEWEQQKPPRDAGWGQPRERKKWPEEKVYIGLESLRNFNVRAKVVGPGGLFVKYIQQETGARVQIKGIGSGYIDHETGRESDEPMHIHMSTPDENVLPEAKRLADDLLDAVRTEYAKAQSALGYAPQQQYGNGPYMPQQQQQQQQPGAYGGGYGAQPYGASGGVQPPLPPAGGEMPPPPPPTDDAPPPPSGNGYAQMPHQQQAYRQPSFTPASNTAPHAHVQQPHQQSQAQQHAATPSSKSPEQEALDKYWKDYVTWEKSFVEYHKRLPNTEEGRQEVPPQYKR